MKGMWVLVEKKTVAWIILVRDPTSVFYMYSNNFKLTFAFFLYLVGGLESNVSLAQQVVILLVASEEPCLFSCTFFLTLVQQIY